MKTLEIKTTSITIGLHLFLS